MEGEGSTTASSAGIRREELLHSFANKFTEPAISLDKANNKGFWNELKTSSSSVMVKLFYQKFRSYLQQLALVLVSLAVVVMACSLRGDVLFIASITYRSLVKASPAEMLTKSSSCTSSPSPHSSCNSSSSSGSGRGSYPADSNNLTSLHHPPLPAATLLPDYLQLPSSYQLPDLLLNVIASVLISEVSYHLICGVLQVYFYLLKRDSPLDWKCQPHRFLTRSNEIHEIIVGTTNLIFSAGLSGVLTCWISSGHYTTMYFTPGYYGYPYLVVSAILLFAWFEASAYYIHKTLHRPWLYKHIHKHHHRYHAPTAYSALSMSPIELLCYYVAVILPLFVVPIYSMVFIPELVYIYYFSLMDHSGVKMDSWFPWQPNTMFHDDHHRYFHCNFGFNSRFFDWLHGTLRRTDRQYGEDIFNPNKKKQ